MQAQSMSSRVSDDRQRVALLSDPPFVAPRPASHLGRNGGLLRESISEREPAGKTSMSGQKCPYTHVTPRLPRDAPRINICLIVTGRGGTRGSADTVSRRILGDGDPSAIAKRTLYA